MKQSGNEARHGCKWTERPTSVLLVDKCQEITQAQKDAVIQPLEGDETYQRMITMILEAEDEEHEVQCFRKQLQEESGLDAERAKIMEWRMRWAIEARRRRRDAEQEQAQRRHEQGQNTGQEQGKKGKQVYSGEEEQTEKIQEESTDEHEIMSKLAEVRTRRGSVGLVQGGAERCLTNKTHGKGKGKGNEGKGEHGRKGGAGNKGTLHVENSVTDEDQENKRAMTSEKEEGNNKEDVRKLVEMMQKEEMKQEEQRCRVALNMEVGGSHHQATSDPREKEAEERRKQTQGMRWADCQEEEEHETEKGRQEEEGGKKEKETRQETGQQEDLTKEERRALEARGREESEEKKEKLRPRKGTEEKKRWQRKRNALKRRRKRIQCTKKTMCRIDT